MPQLLYSLSSFLTRSKRSIRSLAAGTESCGCFEGTTARESVTSGAQVSLRHCTSIFDDLQFREGVQRCPLCQTTCLILTKIATRSTIYCLHCSNEGTSPLIRYRRCIADPDTSSTGLHEGKMYCAALPHLPLVSSLEEVCRHPHSLLSKLR